MTSAAFLFSVVMEAIAASIQGWFRRLLLDRRGDYARPQRFGENQAITRFRAAIGEHSGGIDQAGDGVSKLHLFVANAVPANHGATGLDHFGKSAGKNAFQNCQIGLFRKTYQRERT